MLTSKFGMPPEERASFEASYGDAISSLTTYARYSPALHNNPERLQEELWEMGKYISAAVMGFTQLNLPRIALTDHTKARQFVESLEFKANPGLKIPETEYITSSAGYDTMLNTWHDPMRSNFALKPVLESSDKSSVNLTGLRTCVFMNWHVLKTNVGVWNSAELVDTSASNDIDEQNWRYVSASAGINPIYSYVVAPLSSLVDENPGSPTDVATVAQFSGGKAAGIFAQHGDVGLYQHLLWTNTRLLLGGVSRGPDSQV